MSFDNDIDFSINFNGKFETINGELMYIGGSTHHLEAPWQALFSGIKDAGQLLGLKLLRSLWNMRMLILSLIIFMDRKCLTWKAYCRPILGIDGCFLKSTSKGQLLAAVGRDANNQIYPIAWAIVEVEDTDSWIWFIKKLKTDLDLADGLGYTLISDKQKGLVKAVHEELPQVEHRTCARHLVR